jgi:protein O-GlcNAc transferase
MLNPTRINAASMTPKLTPYRSRSIAAAMLLTSLASAQSLQQADTIYRAGTAALARHDLVTAQTDFEQVTRLAPKAEPGHAALGLVLIDTGHLQQAVRELQLALSLNHADSGAALNLAIAFQKLNQPAKSLPLFAQLEAESRVRHHPLSAAILSAYAHALAASGNLPQATARMKSAVSAEPQNAQLHDDLGSLYAQQKLWSDAQQQFNTALHLDPQSPAAHLHLALALQAQGLPGSLAELQQSHQLAPENPVILLELAKALSGSGNDSDAIPLLYDLLKADPSNTDATLALALALQRTDRAEQAVALFRKVLAAQPDNPFAATDLGMALTQAQRAQEAVPILQHAVTLAPDGVTAHQDLAAAYVQLNQFTDAEAQLKAALQIEPNISQLHYDLGLAYKMQDQATEAIPEFEAAETLDPTQPEAPYALGLLYLQQGRYADAARELKASLSLRPSNGEGWSTLGSVYNHLDQLPEATAALLEAIRQLPEQPDPHLTLANVYIKQKKLDEASAERKVAASHMRSNMNRQRAEVATNSGDSLLKAGDLAGAAAQFKQALTFDPTYSEAHLGLAQIYDAQHNPIAAASERSAASPPHP